MQTFLPYPDFARTARCLDRQRLGKQRVECLQLLRALAGENKGWRNHPACKMWAGNEHYLVRYGLDMCLEWIKRGYRDSCYGKIQDHYARWSHLNPYDFPAWWHNKALYASHRAALLYKDFDHYSQWGWSESPAVPDAKGSLPYVWPV